MVVTEILCTFANRKNKKINKNNNNHFSPSASRLSDENMNEKNVYIVLCNKIIADVFDSPEKAFNSLPKKDDFTEVYQTIRTCDGEEAIIPTADNFYLSTPIYVHVAEHTEDVMGFQVECQEETFVYEIQGFKAK